MIAHHLDECLACGRIGGGRILIPHGTRQSPESTFRDPLAFNGLKPSLKIECEINLFEAPVIATFLDCLDVHEHAGAGNAACRVRGFLQRRQQAGQGKLPDTRNPSSSNA